MSIAKKMILCTSLIILAVTKALAERTTPYKYSMSYSGLFWWLLFVMFIIILLAILIFRDRIRDITINLNKDKNKVNETNIKSYLNKLNKNQIVRIINLKNTQKSKINNFLLPLLAMLGLLIPYSGTAQQVNQITNDNIWNQAGIIITLVLLMIPILLVLIFIFVKITQRLSKIDKQAKIKEAEEVAQYIVNSPLENIESSLNERLTAEEYQVATDSLSGTFEAHDTRGLLQVNPAARPSIVASKKKALPRPGIDAPLSKLIIWMLISATFWLLLGTTIGEYIGIKFVAPDVESLSWLSFGRLRPVHTNSVFWGWASLAMLGLAYYVVPRVSNTKIYSLRFGWYSLHLINASVLLGSISIMAGINNGGGEYREYIWPIMLLFAVALVLTLINFYRTIGQRTTKEIYISNWYIVAAIIFTIIIALVAYLPFWQKGLGETIVQGYYMHQGVGMWFMLFTLGLVYYFLPQQLNKPIYSYSLGVLAFWTQILFYTLIGSHHFVFSSIPWWLQTVAIVGSAGMAIPVIAGTTNFLMTFKGAWYKVKDSYTLPFFLVGIIFYFTGSMQGTAEAFRSTNLIWHFTDFTVAHSHLTMYGIICFLLWGCIYALIPRLSGQEAPQITVGAHFWLALIGMMFYTVPLMYGSTIKGIQWIEGAPFIETVIHMAPYWLWRAIGGSLMWLSHLFFAYNMYKMIAVRKEVDLSKIIIEKLEQQI